MTTSNPYYDIMDDDSLSYCGRSTPKWDLHHRPGWTPGDYPTQATTRMDAPDGVFRTLVVREHQESCRFQWFTVETKVGMSDPSVDIRGTTPGVRGPHRTHYMDVGLGESAGRGFETEEEAREFATKHGRPCVLRVWCGWEQQSATWLN